MAYKQFVACGKLQDIDVMKEHINKSIIKEGFQELPSDSKEWSVINKGSGNIRVDVLFTEDIDYHNKFKSLANG